MDIVKENLDDLNAVLKIRIQPSDYSQPYAAALKKYQKKIELPGFRPGKTPIEIVKKRFGRQILAEEINEILSHSIYKYISDNHIEILGAPLPKENGHPDFEHQTDFEFLFEIGLAPKLNLELSSKDTYPYYAIKTDDALIEKHIEQLRMDYGSVVYPEISEEKDVLNADFAQVDNEGNIVPGGILKTTGISPQRIKNQETRRKFIGLKKEDKIILENLAEESDYLCQITGLAEEKLKTVRLQCRIRNILRIVPAELNQELFDRIYGKGIINSETEMRTKVQEELSGMLAADSDKKFLNKIKDSILEKTSVSLPENFLKKYILSTSKEKISPEQIDTEFSFFANTMKWQLIENYILKKYNLTVSEEELQNFASYLVKMRFTKYGYPVPGEEELKASVKKILEDEKQAKGIYDRLYEQKLIDLFKNTFTIEKKEVTYEEFS